VRIAQLVTDAQAGSADAFGELVRRYQGMAFGYAYALLGDFHLAQDAAQEAMLHAYRSVGALREPKAWTAWLRRIVFKQCDRLRRRKAWTVPLDEAMIIADGSPLPDAATLLDDRRRQLRAALDILSDGERAVVVLCCVHDYRQREVAEFLNVRVDTIKNRLRSARRKLAGGMLAMAQQVLNEGVPNIQEWYAEIQELAEACKRGDIARATALLDKHPDVLDTPDWDERFPYPGSCIWSPLGIAAMHGHEALARLLLDMGANPVPIERGMQYHHFTYASWIDELRDRHYDGIADAIERAIEERYGPLMDTPELWRSVREGDMERVRALIAENPERVRQVDHAGSTALHHAVAVNNLELVRVLVENGSPIDPRNGALRTPLVAAFYSLHYGFRDEPKPEIIDYLLANGAAYTMLIAAARGDEARIRELLRQDPSLANAADPCRRRPVSAATTAGHAHIVRLLLENGANPNAKEATCQGGMSLWHAAWKGNTEIVRMLLDYGAEPNHWLDSSGDAVFAAQKYPEILNLLYAHGATMELQVYAHNYRIDVIAEILRLDPSQANGVLPYGWGDDGSEELAYNIMKLAIRYGARFENASGWNLRWTVKQYPRVFKLLQEHGADPNVQILGISGDLKRRWTDPEHQLRTIRFLVEECGADVDCRDEEGFTPLANASREGYPLLVEYFLGKGADPNASAPDWAKPLFVAQKGGHAEIVEMLRERGAA